MMQHERSIVSAFGLRQRAGAAPTAGRSSDVQSAKTFIERDALRTQGGCEAFAVQAEIVAVELKAQLVIHWLAFLAFPIAERSKPRYVAQIIEQSQHIFRALPIALGK